MSFPYETTLALPEWSHEFLEKHQGKPVEDPMDLAITIGEQHIEQGAGGPFSAVLINEEQKIVSIGMNMVVPYKNPTLHGEMVALIFGAEKQGSFDLSDLSLYSSAEPCAMCAGAIHWAGIQRVYYAATADDVEQFAGFDEGPVHPDWKGWNAERKREVIHLKDYQARAVQILKKYRESDGLIYNS